MSMRNILTVLAVGLSVNYRSRDFNYPYSVGTEKSRLNSETFIVDFVKLIKPPRYNLYSVKLVVQAAIARVI